MAIFGILLFAYGATTFLVPSIAYRGVTGVQRVLFGRRDTHEVPPSVMQWVEMHESAARYDRRAILWIRLHGVVIAAVGVALAASSTF